MSECQKCAEAAHVLIDAPEVTESDSYHERSTRRPWRKATRHGLPSGCLTVMVERFLGYADTPAEELVRRVSVVYGGARWESAPIRDDRKKACRAAASEATDAAIDELIEELRAAHGDEVAEAVKDCANSLVWSLVPGPGHYSGDAAKVWPLARRYFRSEVSLTGPHGRSWWIPSGDPWWRGPELQSYERQARRSGA